MKVTVIGTGYVGLVAGTCFAETGHNVICVDKVSEKISKLQDGIIPIYEPGLEELVKKNYKNGRLQFSTDLEASVKKSKVIFIAVGTPSSKDGSADLSMVLDVAKSIARAMDEPKIIVNKSTVPVGTADKVRKVLKENTQFKFHVVSNPEFLKEGAAIDDFLKPDRVVIGADSQEAFDAMDELYAPFVRQGNPIIHMDNRSAEITKYAANCFLAVKISFINEMAALCEKVGADINDVRRGIGTDQRIGKHFLYPGVGYGGSCFPKDVKALLKTGTEYGYVPEMVQAAENVNENQRTRFFEKIYNHFEKIIGGKKIMIWGLSFKPNTDDMREAPSISIIQKLVNAGAKVHAYDPVAHEHAPYFMGSLYNQIKIEKDMYEGLRDADALVVVTEWNEFRSPDFDKIQSLLKNKLIFDGRNIYEPQKIKNLGFTYYGIGRKN